MKEAAIVLGDDLLRTPYGKTAHGLLRKSDRFHVVGVVEFETGTGDAGELIGAGPLGIPLTGSVAHALAVAKNQASVGDRWDCNTWRQNGFLHCDHWYCPQHAADYQSSVAYMITLPMMKRLPKRLLEMQEKSSISERSRSRLK